MIDGMRSLIAGVLLLALTASAQMKMTVNQLRSFVESSLKLKHPDKQIGEYLKKVTLTEKLDERTIEVMQGQGAGPKTVAALRDLAEASKDLAKPEPPPKIVLFVIHTPSAE